MNSVYRNEGLYIAGPECFYENGYELWWAQRKLAEYFGIPVVLPTSTPLKLDNADKRLNAKEIFDDLVVQVKRTTAIIADLDSFRSPEPDCGTVFELGWIHSKGGKLYGYSRDRRSVATRDQKATVRNGEVFDEKGRKHLYADLPYCPSIMAAVKTVEGDFPTALKLYLSDLEEERKFGRKNAFPQVIAGKSSKKSVYLSFAERDRSHEDEIRYFTEKGYEVLTPYDVIEAYPECCDADELKRSVWRTATNLALIDSADCFVAELSDFRGNEPANDVAFESGYAYGKGKRCIGVMDNPARMRDRIPQRSEGQDIALNTVENFDLPINLMFSASFEIVKGNLFSVASNEKVNATLKG